MKKLNLYSLIAIFLGMIIITSCEKEENPKEPELPPQEAFVMDFSDFQSAPGTKKAGEEMAGYQNFTHAYGTVWGWNIIVTVTMVVPTAAYIEAFNHTPVYLGDNSWKWEYSVPVGNNTFNAKLITTRISNEEFKAEMFITKEGIAGYEDFKWFEGTIRYDRTHAIWTLYESPTNPVEMLEIEWNMDWELGVSDITYTYVKEGDEQTGSYISFAIVDDVVYDANYTVSGAANAIMIEWNRTSKNGRVMDMAKFGDDAWHCWNETLEDVTCE